MGPTPVKDPTQSSRIDVWVKGQGARPAQQNRESYNPGHPG